MESGFPGKLELVKLHGRLGGAESRGGKLKPMDQSISVIHDPAELATALKTRGYLKLRCEPGLTASIHEVLDEADVFFSLPIDIKNKNALEELYEGYRGLASEYSDVADRPDLHESFWVHAFNAAQGRARLDHHGLPLYLSMLHLADHFDKIVASIVVTLQRHYGVPNPDRPQFATSFGSHLQLNYYVPPKHQRDLLMDCHEDGLLFTILHSNASGLEMRTPDGAFIPVTTEPDEVFIMPSDIVMLLSGGEIRPLYHRVRNMPGVPKRTSLMYFSNPDASYDRKITPWRESPVNRNVDIMRRVIENPLKFGLPPIPIVR